MSKEMMNIGAVIRTAVKEEYQRIADEEFELCLARTRDRMAETTSKIAIQMLQHVSISHHGTEIILRVELPK